MVPVTARIMAAPLLAFFVTLVPEAEASPQRRTEQLLELVGKVKKAPERGSLSEMDKAANRELFAELDVFFDFGAMTEMVLRPHVDKLDPENLLVFRDIFPRLIRLVSYPDSGAFLEETEVTIGKEKVEGKNAQVPVRLVREADDLEMEATFYWRDSGTWRLVDLAFDGAPLSKDYQNRIGRVIEEKGGEGLLRKLQKRLKRELRSVR